MKPMTKTLLGAYVDMRRGIDGPGGFSSVVSILVVCLQLLNSPTATAAHLYKERDYQAAWCQGEVEVRLEDDTRVDCLTSEYAIEFDFAPKWAESIGQSLHYSRLTKKKAGVVLIVEKPEDWKHVNKAKGTFELFSIRLWTIKPQDINK